jgi:DNA-binding NarL/FixJ family response regulator
LGYIFYLGKKREKEILVQVQQEQIVQKEAENKELKQKVNTAFEEVVQLAKQNDPSFLTRFQEVYPEVYQKLISVNPKLVNTELVLCAMIWLNFSSKDIAQYTFVQPKTVQVKKHRLRKKLGIPAEEDIYQYLRKL